MTSNSWNTFEIRLLQVEEGADGHASATPSGIAAHEPPASTFVQLQGRRKFVGLSLLGQHKNYTSGLQCYTLTFLQLLFDFSCELPRWVDENPLAKQITFQNFVRRRTTR
jgi:hypothetical protein